MKFTKMHGLGNDYVYINGFEESVESPAELARAVSNRHSGVGSDGLILILPSSTADVRMEMYNADGSRAQMCGNGIRCVAKFAVEHKLAAGPVLRIETDAGIRIAECRGAGRSIDSVRVEMGKPVLDARLIPTTFHVPRVIDHSIRIDGVLHRVTCVSLGNPHAVVFVEDLHRIDLCELGPKFEHAPEFPQRINAHFVRVDSPRQVTVRTWERGAGATRACGTGACAVVVAGALTGRTERGLTVTLPGGSLQIEWAANDHVYMTGEAVEVFTGDWPG